MIIQTINGVDFKLKNKQDFSWLENYGKVFSVIDETGSGCICFGIEDNGHKYFFKIAGADTVESEVSKAESIKLLKDSIKIYEDLRHPNLINLVKHFEYNEFYVAIFDFAEGECLFDHWNFEYYKQNNIVDTPINRFKKLSIDKKMKVIDNLFSFYKLIIEKGYVPVDFYDSSIIYDFKSDTSSFCDIDLFRKMPTFNDIGVDYFGTKRLKSPEENELNAVIDEKTAVFNLGALVFDLLSDVKNTKQRRQLGMFIPNDRDDFVGSDSQYNALIKATNYDRNLRYSSIIELEKDFYK